MNLSRGGKLNPESLKYIITKECPYARPRGENDVMSKRRLNRRVSHPPTRLDLYTKYHHTYIYYLTSLAPSQVWYWNFS